jgi:hypothetical protein
LLVAVGAAAAAARHALLAQRALRLPARREEVYICIFSLLGRNFASPFALAVGGGNRNAQWPAGGKNAFASRCWTQSYINSKNKISRSREHRFFLYKNKMVVAHLCHRPNKTIPVHRFQFGKDVKIYLFMKTHFQFGRDEHRFPAI